MEKQNLVLVHSFPTNSILLSGVIEYLNDYFKVYPIDLPGFTKKSPPLSKISFDGYYRFAEDKVREFNLENYLASGISFGFLIVNNMHHYGRCKGIIALEPYIGPDSLRMGLFKGALYAIFIKGVCFLNLSSVVWKSRALRTYLPKLRDYASGAIDVVLDQIDGRTFFETANLILSDKGKYGFQDMPYVVVANKEDRTVNYDYLYRTFTENVKRLLVVNTTIEHYPKELTKKYFMEHIPEEVIEKILDFFASSEAR